MPSAPLTPLRTTKRELERSGSDVSGRMQRKAMASRWTRGQCQTSRMVLQWPRLCNLLSLLSRVVPRLCTLFPHVWPLELHQRFLWAHLIQICKFFPTGMGPTHWAGACVRIKMAPLPGRVSGRVCTRARDRTVRRHSPIPSRTPEMPCGHTSCKLPLVEQGTGT